MIHNNNTKTYKSLSYQCFHKDDWCCSDITKKLFLELHKQHRFVYQISQECLESPDMRYKMSHFSLLNLGF